MSFLTIEQHLLDQQQRYPNATGAFSGLLRDIALAGKIVAREIAQGALADMTGATDQRNVHGEVQKKLDVFADETLYRICSSTRRLCIMASEEHEEVLQIPAAQGYGSYALLVDPLDGSSNVDSNVSMGTIFAIYRKVSPGESGTLADLLQPGRDIAAAGYILYGPSTMLVYSTGQGVHGFTLDPAVGEFLLTHEHIQIPDSPSYYSGNQGNERQWMDGIRHFVGMLQGKNASLRLPRLTARYTGSLVADFHRNLLHGGIYFYPADPMNICGKLRLAYEAVPLAFIAQQAGGYGSNGIENILDLQPGSLHQRVPLFVGNRSLVEIAEQMIGEHDRAWVSAYRASTQTI